MSMTELQPRVEPRTVELSDGGRVQLTHEQAELVAIVLQGVPTLSPRMAAMVLGVSRPMVVRWIEAGHLEDQPIGAHHRIPMSSVFALRNARNSADERAVKRVLTAREDAEIAESLTSARTRARAAIEKRDAPV